MDDNKLQELFAKRSEIDGQIKQRKRQIAKDEGLVVDSIDALVCKNHPGSHFKVLGSIPGSRDNLQPKGNKLKLDIYICDSCETEEARYSASKAYDCPECGIVLGEVEKVPYQSTQPRASCEGEQYACTVCGTMLGFNYWLIS